MSLSQSQAPPSRYRRIFEALACPCAVRLGHEETGRLVPPGNPEALTAALGTVASDPGLQRKLGGAGRGRAMAFDIETIVDRYLDPDRSLEAGRP